MKRPFESTIATSLKTVRRAVCVAMVASLCLVDAPMAFAKKKPEVEAAPTKSYVAPYMIVLVLLGVGLMTVCRPSSRNEKMDDKKKKGEDEE